MQKLSIIIPCFNEKDTVKQIIQKVETLSIPNWQIGMILVDDASSDGTREILKEYENTHTVLYHGTNQGKGSAVKTGIERTTGDYILIQDADLEYDPGEIPKLIEAIREKRAVYGSRNLDRKERKGLLLARMGVWFLTKEFNFLFKTRLTDIWTCYKLFPRSAGKFFTAGRFESELSFSAELIKNGFEIVEVPISHYPRAFSEGKKIRYRDGIKGIWILLKSWFRQILS